MDRSGIPVDALCSLWIIGRGTRFRHRAAVRRRPFAATIWARRNSIAVDKSFAHSLKEVHEFLANLLVILAVFHMAAALVHHIVFGDNTLRRMLPRLRR
jgi:cytochrome b561